MKKIIKIIDVIYYTLYYAAQNLLRISAATPLTILIIYLYLHSMYDAQLLYDMQPMQLLLAAVKATSPIALIFLPFYDCAQRYQHHEHLTEFGIKCYTAAWIITFATIVFLPNTI